MNERPSLVPKHLSEAEVEVMKITGEINKIPEMKATPYEDSAEGLVEQMVEENKERVTLENISEAIKKHAAENDGAKPLDVNEFNDSVDVDTSELDSDYEEFRSPDDMDKAA